MSTSQGNNGQMAFHYLPPGGPDLEDFFSQIVPTPPPTAVAGGTVFMAPLDPESGLWFAYSRDGQEVKRFDGELQEVKQWALDQSAAVRWIYSAARAAYVRWPEPLQQTDPG